MGVGARGFERLTPRPAVLLLTEEDLWARCAMRGLHLSSDDRLDTASLVCVQQLPASPWNPVLRAKPEQASTGVIMTTEAPTATVDAAAKQASAK